MSEPGQTEAIEAIRAGLVEAGQQVGPVGVAQLLENALFRLIVADWGRCAPGSAGRLKRIYRALKK